MCPEGSSRAGLSLLELLVALALLALIATGIAGAFGLGNQLWNRAETLGQFRQEVALRGQLRHFLRQTLPPNRLSPFQARFDGRVDQFSFVTLAETPFAPDTAALRITVAAQEESLVLITSFLDDDSAVIRSLTDVLAAKATDIRFSYYAGEGDAAEWRDLWTDDVTLPRLIRIEVAKGSMPPWPEFTVRPRLQ